MRLFDPRFPFDPSRSPVFYGWVIVVAAIVGVLCSIPGQTMGVSVFTDHLMSATGLSRLALANAYLIGTFASGFLIPMGGRIIDRWGTRPTILVSACCLAATLAALTQCDRAVIALGGSAAAGTAVMSIGFFLLRFFGQGMLTLTSRTMLGRWWDRKRGLVAGISGLFVAFGFAASPLAFQGLIDFGGWRGAWLILAATTLGFAGFAWTLFRDRPEQVGLHMDGLNADQAAAATQDTSRIERGFTRSEAMRTRAFWALVLPLGLNGLTVTAITFHIVDVGALAGLDRHAAVAIFLPMAVVSTATGYLTGLAADRWPLPRLILLFLVLQAIGYTATVGFGSSLGRSVMIAGIGGANGCFATLVTVGLPRFFGRTHLGAIGGVQMSVMVIGSAIGPAVFAAAKRITTSYDIALYACLVPVVMLIGLALGVRNPQNDQYSRS
ncbi:MAG: MFS transporter [Planctomycetota bacterium]|jgi:OFA family oxalate/formate antiporter-like MFS transporter|nr:MFS transporter [Planctomycetota bacterium]